MLYRILIPVFKFLKRFPYLLPLSLAFIVFLAVAPIIFAKIYQSWDDDKDRGAIAIDKGAYGESYATPRYLEQGWANADSLWFYNTTQGSGLMPYDFFLKLRQENSNEFFRDKMNIDKYRYLPQKATLFNPDGLPVGFVKTTYKGKDYVGYTCSACHTGQINYKGQAVRIDGGPAMSDMDEFLTDMRKAMTATQSGEKLKTFIADVQALKNDYKDEKEIVDDLRKWTDTVALYNTVNHSNVEYGHARLDAFGRIYNRVLQHAITRPQLEKLLALVVVKKGDGEERLLSKAMIDKVVEGTGERVVLVDADFSLIVKRLRLPKEQGYPGLSLKEFLHVRNMIFNPPNAPVSYPFLWDIAHSDYVQWNGVASNAAAGPLGRNAGEVIGVFGILDWGKEQSWSDTFPFLKKLSLSAILTGQSSKKDVISFRSSINLFNLGRLESSLRKLKSPEWPFCINSSGEYYLPTGDKVPSSPSAEGYCSGDDKRFDEAKKNRGELLYIARCQGCHTSVDRSAWDRVVIGSMSSVKNIGTDVAMAENSVKYRGKSGNFKDTYQSVDIGSLVVPEDAPVLQILTAATKGVVATPDHDKFFLQRWVEWVYTLVSSIGDNTIKGSAKAGGYSPDTTATPYDSLLAYRARSLNGIWATAPYLHNGSVPTMWDLLLPASKRPSSFKVGTRDYDPVKVGFKNEGKNFNTIQRGNHNTGHDKYCPDKSRLADDDADPKEAAAKDPPDKDCLTDNERWDLIEFLKSL